MRLMAFTEILAAVQNPLAAVQKKKARKHGEIHDDAIIVLFPWNQVLVGGDVMREICSEQFLTFGLEIFHDHLQHPPTPIAFLDTADKLCCLLLWLVQATQEGVAASVHTCSHSSHGPTASRRTFSSQ